MNRSTTASWVKLMAGTAVLSLTLAACGGGDDTDNEADEPAASESTSESSEAAAEYTNDVCEGNVTSADTFKVGGVLPITGNLAFLGPPEIAGVGLAVSDINAAGGVNGADACHQIEDSGDSTDLSIAQASANGLVRGEPSVVIGAASSSVSEAIIGTFTDAQITQVSPANTAVALSGISDFYFRTAPPDGVQGNALATLLAQDGVQNVGFLVFNDTYGTGLRDVVEDTFTAGGGSCVYGCQGDGNEFPAGQTTFSSEVADVLAAGPDAIVVLAFDETKSIIPELVNQGWDNANTYLVDGNTSDYSADFNEGDLLDAQGTIPGADASQEFKDAANAWYEQTQGESLTGYSYTAESYDATILAALAAAKGGANDSATVQANYAAVSGATDGEECTTYEDCLALIEEGSEIRYTGPSGIGPINEQNDPSSAFVGIYRYLEDNNYELTTTVEGTS